MGRLQENYRCFKMYVMLQFYSFCVVFLHLHRYGGMVGENGKILMRPKHFGKPDRGHLGIPGHFYGEIW